MALTRRQEILYTDTVTIYKKTPGAKLDGRQTVKDPKYSLIASDVKCKKFASIDTANPDSVGRTTQDNFFTKDEFHFPAGTTGIDDTCVLKLTTAGHPDLNEYTYVQGNAQQVPSSGRRVPNFLMVMGVRGIKLQTGDIV